MRRITTANKITIVRILLIPVFMVFLFLDVSWGRYVAVAVFVAASASDFLDGYVARKYRQITDLGKFMDPLADKLLIMAAFVGLVELSLIQAWIVIVILAREFIVTALRTIAAANGRVIAASLFGKAKTFVQILGVIYLMLFGDAHVVMGVPVSMVINILILIITIASGADYLYKNRKFLK